VQYLHQAVVNNIKESSMQKAKRDRNPSEIVHTSASKPKGDARDCIRHHTVRGTNKNKREKYFPVAIAVDPPPNKMLKIAPTTTNPNPIHYGNTITANCSLHFEWGSSFRISQQWQL